MSTEPVGVSVNGQAYAGARCWADPENSSQFVNHSCFKPGDWERQGGLCVHHAKEILPQANPGVEGGGGASLASASPPAGNADRQAGAGEGGDGDSTGGSGEGEVSVSVYPLDHPWPGWPSVYRV